MLGPEIGEQTLATVSVLLVFGQCKEAPGPLCVSAAGIARRH